MTEQVRKGTECEECIERRKTVQEVLKRLQESDSQKTKKGSLFDFLESISKQGREFFEDDEDENRNRVLIVKIEITWPKDMQHT